MLKLSYTQNEDREEGCEEAGCMGVVTVVPGVTFLVRHLLGIELDPKRIQEIQRNTVTPGMATVTRVYEVKRKRHRQRQRPVNITHLGIEPLPDDSFEELEELENTRACSHKS